MENKRLRPVLFKVWIPEQFTKVSTFEVNLGNTNGKVRRYDDEPKVIDGTGGWSDYAKPGLFHCWGTSVEAASHEGFYIVDGKQRTVAIIEDKHGHIYEIKPDHIKFTDV